MLCWSGAALHRAVTFYWLIHMWRSWRLFPSQRGAEKIAVGVTVRHSFYMCIKQVWTEKDHSCCFHSVEIRRAPQAVLQTPDLFAALKRTYVQPLWPLISLRALYNYVSRLAEMHLRSCGKSCSWPRCRRVSPGRGREQKLEVSAWRSVSRCWWRRLLRPLSCITSPSSRSTAARMLSTCFCRAALRSSYSMWVLRSCRISASRAGEAKETQRSSEGDAAERKGTAVGGSLLFYLLCKFP